MYHIVLRVDSKLFDQFLCLALYHATILLFAFPPPSKNGLNLLSITENLVKNLTVGRTNLT